MRAARGVRHAIVYISTHMPPKGCTHVSRHLDTVEGTQEVDGSRRGRRREWGLQVSRGAELPGNAEQALSCAATKSRAESGAPRMQRMGRGLHTSESPA